MNQEELDTLDSLRKCIEQLTHGERASALELPEDCDGTVKRLVEAFNQYLSLNDEARSFINSLASGDLEVTPPPKNQIAAPYKQLHAALQHLSWQTRQIAHGDYSQRVHFLGGFSDSFNSMIDALAEKERIESALKDARNQVLHLEGIIPICMYCKKIRDDKNSWQQLERYISEHSEALFSHGICPTCMKEQYSIIHDSPL